MKQDKLYYNTEYRKKLKILSKFNIFIKDRITEKDEIQEVILKKNIRLVAPLIYKNLYNFYKLIKKSYNRWIYKINCNIKQSLEFYESLYIFEDEKIFMFFRNQLSLEYFFCGFVYFFLIVNWIWSDVWEKWASFTDILEYRFFRIDSIFRYINNYFMEFSNNLIKHYKSLVLSIFFDSNIIENNINLYNFYLFNSLELFYVFFNMEYIKLEHEKCITKEKDWDKIRRVIFNYFNLDLLNNYFNLSFFSFIVYEFFLLFNKYNLHYLTITFFEYRVNLIIEKNVSKYFNSKKNKETFKFDNFNLKNLCIKIYKSNFFSVRINYNLFLSNVDYFIYLKTLTYNFYIRSCEYFLEFASQRKIFLKYNNSISDNRGSLSAFGYDVLFKRYLLASNSNINKSFNFFNIERFEPFFNYYNRQNQKNTQYITDLLFKDFNVRFLYKLNKSKKLNYSLNQFFNFNLIDFFNKKNRLESYKDVMAIDSVYEYRFANNAFKTMNEFMLLIFKTPLDYSIYFDTFYKNISYKIVYDIYFKYNKYFFFKDLVNIYDKKFLKKYIFFLRGFGKIFKMRTYFFKFNYLWKLLKHEDTENILRVDIYNKMFDYFEDKKMFFILHKFSREHFYKKWGIQKFFNIIKYNSMFYLDIYSMSILFNGWLYEIMFFSWYLTMVNVYNKFFYFFNLSDNYKYLTSFKDFYFQLVLLNIDYVLIFIFIFIKKIKINNRSNFINRSNMMHNNFVYRKYTLYTWLEYNYYDDLFDDLDVFTKEVYSIKLSQWILRYFYSKAESHLFYSESMVNKYINKSRLFL